MEIWIFKNLVDFTICVLVTCLITSTKAQGDVSCDFEKGFCGWTQDTNDEFDWTNNRGSTATWWTGPDEDHTSGDGYYIYIEANDKTNEDKARITSPQVEEGKYCITFSYIMYGRDVNTLNVYMKTKQKEDQIMFSKKRDMGKNWNQAHISMHSSTTFQIAIEGVTGNGDHGDIAVDDILLKSGWCSDCNFDDGLCEWTQDDTDDIDWKEGQCETTSADTGPEADHTSKNGTYIYIDTSFTSNDDTARITSPQMDPGQYCFKFWYIMYGRDVNALNIYGKINKNLGTPILSLENNTGISDWRQAHVYIQSSHDFQIVIESVAGDGAKCDIAIDDIEMDSDLCLTDTVTTEASTLSISPAPSILTTLTSRVIASTTATTLPNGSPNTGTEGRSLTAVYVLVPVVGIIIVAAVVIIYLRRRAKDRPGFGYLGSMPANNPPPILANDGYINHFLNSNTAMTLNGDVPGTDDNVYTEIDLNNLQSTSDEYNNEYNTIEERTIELPEHSYEQMANGAEPYTDAHMDNYPDEKRLVTVDNTYLNITN